jgi:hypothetical protein
MPEYRVTGRKIVNRLFYQVVTAETEAAAREIALRLVTRNTPDLQEFVTETVTQVPADVIFTRCLDEPMTDLSDDDYEGVVFYLVNKIYGCIEHRTPGMWLFVLDDLDRTRRAPLTLREWIAATGAASGVDVSSVMEK